MGAQYPGWALIGSQLEKYNNVQFGRCPRAYCCGQACLPVGTSDIPRTSTVKTYCPKCCDIYYTRNKYQGNIDGAYFGTTFPHLFLMTFSYLKSPRPTQVYTPRIFGFRVRLQTPPPFALSCSRPSLITVPHTVYPRSRGGRSSRTACTLDAFVGCGWGDVQIHNPNGAAGNSVRSLEGKEVAPKASASNGDGVSEGAAKPSG